LTIIATVIKKIDRLNSIELQTDILNQHKQIVTTGIAKIKIIEDEITSDDRKTINEKTVLIIGSTGGIGMQTARTLATEGYNLILHYHSNKAKVDQLKQELEGLSDKKIVIVKALAVELAPNGIRVNLVSAGMTNTNLISDTPEKIKLITAARTPLRRLAEPQDVADAISYLISEKSDFLTGETIRVNGGQVMV